MNIFKRISQKRIDNDIILFNNMIFNKKLFDLFDIKNKYIHYKYFCYLNKKDFNINNNYPILIRKLSIDLITNDKYFNYVTNL